MPGETALITAGVLAAAGHLAIVPVIALAAIGATVGDNIGYALGRRLGRRFLLRAGRLEELRARMLERAESFFARHGPKAVFLGRWITGLRVWAAWLAGAGRMEWRVFFAWNALGGIAWATTVGLAAYLAGEAVTTVAERAGEVIAGLVVVAAVAALVVARRRR